MRKTKIICTLGPAVDSEKAMRQLILKGMNAARFNFSHGTHESHRAQLLKLKRVRDELGPPWPPSWIPRAPRSGCAPLPTER